MVKHAILPLIWVYSEILLKYSHFMVEWQYFFTISLGRSEKFLKSAKIGVGVYLALERRLIDQPL